VEGQVTDRPIERLVSKVKSGRISFLEMDTIFDAGDLSVLLTSHTRLEYSQSAPQ